MAKQIGPQGTPRGQGRGLRRQMPTGLVVAAIVVAVLVVGFIMWRTGVVGGPMKEISDEMRAVHRQSGYQVPVDPKTGMSPPYEPGVTDKLEKSEGWTPEAEKYKPK